MNENEIMTENMADENVDYIAAINELKANSVDRKHYDKLKLENKRLLDTLISGGQIEQTKEVVDKDKLRKELYVDKSCKSNLEYWTKTMQLRDAIIEDGGQDPFCANGTKIAPTMEDFAAADRVAAGINHCIEVADGDNSIFTNELQRIMVDVPIPRRKR